MTAKLDIFLKLVYNLNREVICMLIRDKYLKQMIAGKDLNLIKVITGVRRSGKSTLLLQYKNYLISEKIKEEDII